jgi:hypothetical protein
VSVLHETSRGSGRRWTFTFGNAHDLPPEYAPDEEVWPVKAPGVNGEGHFVGLPGGRDLFIEAKYSGYATEAALRTAFRNDAAQSHRLTGTLLINGIQYPACTFLGVSMTMPPMRDGKNNKWYVTAVLRWRQRET